MSGVKGTDVKSFLAVFFVFLATASAAERPHPFLLVNREEIAAAKEKAARQPWARTALAHLITAANSALSEPAAAPEKVGQWPHWYSCPKHGARLQAVTPTQHRCPVDGEIFTGDPYDAVVVGREHSRLAAAARDTALAYQFTGDSKYARHAAAILLAYAARYNSYPRHTTTGKDAVGGGKVMAQTLDEAVWLIPMAWAYDLVWDTLTPEERGRIEAGLLLPAAAVIRDHRMPVHNIQCWKNSAVGLVGFVTGNDELVRDGIDNPDRGFRRQIRDGITNDGLWYEGSLGYHAYTMEALWPLAEAARHAGLDLYSERYRSLLTAPLRLALPNGDAPGFNDNAGGSVMSLGRLYELAYARWKTPEFGAVAGAQPRNSREALLYGAEELPRSQPIVPEESTMFADAGFAILRARHAEPAEGPGRVDAVAVRFGRHGGGHGHPDKLGIVLFGAGQLLALDPGSIAYGVPLHREWYRTTVAHNTVVVDGQSQAPADGALEKWEPADAGGATLVANAGGVYPGVRLRRALALRAKGADSILADRFSVSSESEHTYDWLLHVNGEPSSPLKFEPCAPAGNTNGYQHIGKWERAAVPGDWEMAWTSGKARLILKMKGVPGTEVYRGVAPGRNPADRVPLVLVRRRTASTVFDAQLITGPAQH